MCAVLEESGRVEGVSVSIVFGVDLRREARMIWRMGVEVWKLGRLRRRKVGMRERCRRSSRFGINALNEENLQVQD